jgi:acyl transferase domain-containing protein
MMVTVGLSREEALERCCSKAVTIAGVDSRDQVTLSGPFPDVLQVVNQLVTDGVKVRFCPSIDKALHSPEMAFLWSNAMSSLYSVIPEPRGRSERWLSSTAPEPSSDYLRLCCPRYFLRNLTSPVHFYDTSKTIPKNALVLELSHRPVLESLIRRNVTPDVAYLSMSFLRRVDPDEGAALMAQELAHMGVAYEHTPTPAPPLAPTRGWPQSLQMH